MIGDQFYESQELVVCFLPIRLFNCLEDTNESKIQEVIFFRVMTDSNYGVSSPMQILLPVNKIIILAPSGVPLKFVKYKILHL